MMYLVQGDSYSVSYTYLVQSAKYRMPIQHASYKMPSTKCLVESVKYKVSRDI